MAWIKFHQSNMVRKDYPVAFNTDTIFKAEASDEKTRLHFVAPSGGGHSTELVNESLAEVMFLLGVENVSD